MITLPKILNQQDARWANALLGNNNLSRFNIFNYGCLLTDICMILAYFGHDMTVLELNELLKKNRGFVPNGGDYVWGAVRGLYPEMGEHKTDTPGLLTDSQMAEIKNSIDSGYPVLLLIDYNPKTVIVDFHYVIAVGYNPADENDFTVVDPIGGATHSLKDYLGGFFPSARKTIQQYAIFTGNKPTVLENAILVRIEDNERNVRKATQYDEVCNYLKLDSNMATSTDVIKLMDLMLKKIIEQDGKILALNGEIEKQKQNLLDTLKEVKRQDGRIGTIEEKVGQTPEPTAFQELPPANIAITEDRAALPPEKKQSLLSRILSFFLVSLEEYGTINK